MTLKTKDILKILRLVKKNKKSKKRRRKNKKVIVTTQQIAPSTLQPYEINRQAPQNTIQLDNMRLNNKLLENNLIEYNKNKAKESDDTIKNIQDSISLTSSSISDINNKNMELNDRLNKVITYGNNFMNQTNRKFDDHELKLNDVQKEKINMIDVAENPSNYFIEDNPVVNVGKSDDEQKDDHNLTQMSIDTVDTPEPKLKGSKAYKGIEDINVRKLIKKIELENSNRNLTNDEKITLKDYFKNQGMRWSNSTKYSKAVITQLKNKIKK